MLSPGSCLRPVGLHCSICCRTLRNLGTTGRTLSSLLRRRPQAARGGPAGFGEYLGATAALRVRMFLFQGCINVERCLSSSCRSPVLGLWSSAPLHSDPWSCHHNKLPGLIDGWMAWRRVDPRSRVSSPRHSRCLSSKNLEIKVPRYHRRRQPRRQSFWPVGIHFEPDIPSFSWP
jgi:hypothetical protein